MVQYTKDMEVEDKRLKMLHRDPKLAEKLYPFAKRMGVEGFMKMKRQAHPTTQQS